MEYKNNFILMENADHEINDESVPVNESLTTEQIDHQIGTITNNLRKSQRIRKPT